MTRVKKSCRIIWACLYTNTHMGWHTHVRTHTHIHTYTHTHTHTHTLTHICIYVYTLGTDSEVYIYTYGTVL